MDPGKATFKRASPCKKESNQRAGFFSSGASPAELPAFLKERNLWTGLPSHGRLLSQCVNVNVLVNRGHSHL